MSGLRFHERHFPTLSRLRELFSRPFHWTAHLGMVTFITAILVFSAYQVTLLANLRHAVAERQAVELLETPHNEALWAYVLGPSIVCEPALLRWYYGTGPLCELRGIDDIRTDR